MRQRLVEVTDAIRIELFIAVGWMHGLVEHLFDIRRVYLDFLRSLRAISAITVLFALAKIVGMPGVSE